MKNYQPLETTDRFLKDAIKGAGFTFNGCIAEFIDNSIDACAKKITIKAIEQNKDLYDLIITDDGKGIPPEKIYDAVKKLGFGNLEDYSSNAISNYGLGMKFAIVNLCSKGEAIISSTHNKRFSSVYLKVDNVPSVRMGEIEKVKRGKNTTQIHIPNVKISSNQITSLLKFLGCTYFPHVDNGNKLKIILQHRGKETTVNFSDPLYRNKSKGVNDNNDEVEINGYKIYIRGRYFNTAKWNADDYSAWDIKQGGAGFAMARSGVYFRLGGRYITLGNAEFYSPGAAKSDQQVRNRLRIEVEIDRELISNLGISFNKSLLNTDLDNPLLRSFFESLDSIVSWGQKNLWNISRGKKYDQSDEEKEKNEEVEDDINARRRIYPLDVEELGIENKENENKKNDPEGTKNRPKGLKYNNYLLNFRFTSNGNNSQVFDYWRERKKLIIEFNTDHNFYGYYNSLDTSSKKVAAMMILSIIDSIEISKFDISTGNPDWEQDILVYLSTRLNKYCRL